MSPAKERTSPAAKPTPKKKPKAYKSKPVSRKMHPAAVKRRDERVKKKAPPQRPLDPPLEARDIPKDSYTVVYAGSVIWLDVKKVRHKLQRGEIMNLTSAQYEGCSDVLKRALVKGALTMEQIHKLLKDSKGQVPGAAAYGKAPLEAVDFASALPVKDQDSQATSVSLSLPNFVPMSTDDIMSWAALSPTKEWLGDKTLDGLTKKRELVKAIKDRAAEVEGRTAPAGEFEDV